MHFEEKIELTQGLYLQLKHAMKTPLYLYSIIFEPTHSKKKAMQWWNNDAFIEIINIHMVHSFHTIYSGLNRH